MTAVNTEIDPQVIIDASAWTTAEIDGGTQKGYMDSSSAITFNGGNTILFSPAQNNATVNDQFTFDGNTVVLDRVGGHFLLPFYMPPEDVARWQLAGGAILYTLISNEPIANTNYLQENIGGSDWRQGWNYFHIGQNKDIRAADSMGGQVRDTGLGANDHITTQTGRIQFRCDLGAASMFPVGGGTISINITNGRIALNGATDAIVGEAVFFTAGTLPTDSSGNLDSTYFISEIVFPSIITISHDPEGLVPVVFLTVGATIQLTHTPRIYYGDLTHGAVSKTALCIICDDGNESDFLELYEGANLAVGLKELGYPATVHPHTDVIDGTDILTTAEIVELHNAGWTCGHQTINGTEGTGSLGALTDFTQVVQQQRIQDAGDVMNAITGSNDGLFMSYPTGAFNSETIAAAKAAGTLMARAVSGGPTHRGTITSWALVQPNGEEQEWDNMYRVWGQPVDSAGSNTPENALSVISDAIQTGQPLVIVYMHKIVISGATGVSSNIGDIDTLIAGIKEFVDDGILSVLNMRDSYARLLKILP